MIVISAQPWSGYEHTSSRTVPVPQESMVPSQQNIVMDTQQHMMHTLHIHISLRGPVFLSEVMQAVLVSLLAARQFRAPGCTPKSIMVVTK